jgi:AraC-like DNA-binding protein
MIHELYDIISIYVTAGLLLSGGLSFLFVTIPDSPLLQSYRKARRAMAYAYLFFAAVNVVEYLFRNSENDTILLTQMITLAVAFSQSFLFTFAMISLINVRWMEGRRFFRELTLVLTFIATVFIIRFTLPADLARTAFYVFIGLYLVQLIRYIRLFILNRRQFLRKMDNFFADGQERHLRWVVFSFGAALIIGILALFSALFMTHLGALIFSCVLAVFYGYFAVRFIRYGFSFRIIEPAMEEVEPVPADETDSTCSPAFASIEARITQWIAQKGFTQQGITLGKLATELYTNRNYLSVYINDYKKQTFCNWISELRIEEAKQLLIQYPDMNLQEIANRCGFAERSHFTRHFTQRTGLSPKFWKQQNTIKN